MKNNYIKMSGKRFGRYIVIKPSFVKSSSMYWLCRCDCGVEKNVKGRSLRNGEIKSCGCYSREFHLTQKFKHGYAGTRTYRSWNTMMHRCYSTDNIGYNLYGKRGIKVIQRWHEFKNFLLDMGERPERMTLDRIDNDRDYEPSNCRWATLKEQATNRRNTIYVEVGGIKIPLSNIGKMIGVNQGTVNARFRKGFPVEKILSQKSLGVRKLCPL